MGRLYKRFIEPRQRDEDVRNRERVLNVLAAGTSATFGAAFTLLVVSLCEHNHFVLTRTILVGLGMVTALVAYYLSRRGHHRAGALLLLAMYAAVATGVAYRWSVTVPTAILLFGLIVVLSGILLGARYIPPAMVVVLLDLTILRTLQVHGIVRPDWSGWANVPLELGTLAGCYLIFAILALVSWLYTSQMERSLLRARRAEKALLRQKQLLEVMVERRTRQLQDAQLEKVQQLYRFAELGQLSTALLHDLANHLTTLSLDIAGLEEQTRSSMLRRAKRSIGYIDDMVGRVRDQLHGRAVERLFAVQDELDEIVTILNHRAQNARVQLRWEAPAHRKALRIKGDTTRFRQLMVNLISNGIDAYPPPKPGSTKPREVAITAEAREGYVIITVGDWGRGISKSQRAQLFEPFFSTKKTGMGMGLFIAKQIAEDHFRGELRLDARKTHTAFIVTLPQA